MRLRTRSSRLDATSPFNRARERLRSDGAGASFASGWSWTKGRGIGGAAASLETWGIGGAVVAWGVAAGVASGVTTATRDTTQSMCGT